MLEWLTHTIGCKLFVCSPEGTSLYLGAALMSPLKGTWQFLQVQEPKGEVHVLLADRLSQDLAPIKTLVDARETRGWWDFWKKISGFKQQQWDDTGIYWDYQRKLGSNLPSYGQIEL